jgi:hypothetical protein
MIQKKIGQVGIVLKLDFELAYMTKFIGIFC